MDVKIKINIQKMNNELEEKIKKMEENIKILYISTINQKLEIDKLTEGNKNVNIALGVVVEENNELREEIKKLKGHKDCRICFNNIKLLQLPCCEQHMCRDCWNKIYNYNETCPFCRNNMNSFEDRLAELNGF